MDILIKDGLLHDGCRNEPFISDILISAGRILSIGVSVTADADMVIDAKGLVVSPGFIDSHSHSDFTILADPRAEGKILQGITTEINGNCGMSAGPLYGKAVERREADLRELGIRERWNSLGEYMRIIKEKGIAVNTAFLAGHGNIRGSVVGYEDKSASDAYMTEMRRLLRETIDDGAIGLSTGLIYPPGLYSDTEELVNLSCVLKEKELIYTSHMRSEGDSLVDAVDEVISIGKRTGIRVHISHIKTAGQQNWHKAEKVISRLDEAMRSGVRISCDRYPYTASSTDLDSILPPWVFAGGNEEELRRLGDDNDRKRIMDGLKQQCSSAGYWGKVIVSSVVTDRNRWMEGLTLEEISKKLGTDEMNALFRILIGERLRVGAVFLSMSEENLGKFLSLSYCMIGSDSSARCFDGPTKQGKPHPRTFGTFPRLFGRYVREEGLLSLSEAIYKSTSLAAETFGLRDRGKILEGMHADIVVFDPDEIIDKATFEDPYQRPEGIGYVLVNGVPAVWEGRATGSLSGEVLTA
ncbi:MAG: D-aminoacylase [Nitrospirae bacterium]|nr:D-aminoacylase [Nitrospirota bacterium]